MTRVPGDFLIKACKQNMDCGMRVVEALLEGATKIRELQLEAATEAHAGTVATQKSIASAGDPADMWRQYGQWMVANTQKSIVYWQAIAKVLAETNAEVLKCLGEGAQAAGAVTGGEDAAKQALSGLLDSAYKQWVDATREFYNASAALPFAVRPPAAQPPAARPSA
jgi:hypothetical protein